MNTNNVRVQRYLTEYTFALPQAESIIVSGKNSTGQANNTTGQNSSTNSNSSNSNSNNQGNGQKWGSPEQLLNIYLQWMRGLRMKIENGGPGTSSIQ